ncbi:MAG TPA: dephospho-CoA kinase [Acidimicrobiales bacterium]|nr:dephospho-CoA kinase [Acidimicrobiales bacterium]
MKLVGLTGGIGAGKSTVSARLRERGAVIVDADAITRELQEPGTEVFAAMVARFGDGILAPDGTLDRQAVAAVVFNDPDELVALNSIVHPAVGKEIFRRIQERIGTDDVVVLDVPLLGKNGLYQVAGVLVVDTPIETAVQRLVELRGMDEADARARIANQISREERVAGADMVIDNSGAPGDLDAQIDATWDWIESLPDWAP